MTVSAQYIDKECFFVFFVSLQVAEEEEGDLTAHSPQVPVHLNIKHIILTFINKVLCCSLSNSIAKCHFCLLITCDVRHSAD